MKAYSNQEERSKSTEQKTKGGTEKETEEVLHGKVEE